MPTWYTQVPTHSPIGSKPALRTSRNSLTEKSDVNTPVECAELRKPLRRSLACAGISNVMSDRSLGIVRLIRLVVLRGARQRRLAGADIHNHFDVVWQRGAAPGVHRRRHHDVARQIALAASLAFVFEHLAEVDVPQHSIALGPRMRP